MSILFYVSAVVAVITALLVVTRANAMHALISLVILFLSIASIFFTLGAPFVAVLQIIIYAGAIMILFVFVIMMLNLGHVTEQRERGWLGGIMWVIPVILAAALFAAFVFASVDRGGTLPIRSTVGPKAVGVSLFTTYLIGVELASILLVAGLVAAFHFGAFLGRLGVDDE